MYSIIVALIITVCKIDWRKRIFFTYIYITSIQVHFLIQETLNVMASLCIRNETKNWTSVFCFVITISYLLTYEYVCNENFKAKVNDIFLIVELLIELFWLSIRYIQDSVYSFLALFWYKIHFKYHLHLILVELQKIIGNKLSKFSTVLDSEWKLIMR